MRFSSLRSTTPTHRPVTSIVRWRKEMRSSLFLLLTFISALPISAEGLLPRNLPVNWKTVDNPESESGIQELGWEVRINSDDGDILIASRYANDGKSDDATSSVKPSIEQARKVLLKWWASGNVANVTNLRARKSVLSNIRTSHSREGADSGNVTKHPIVLTTFVLETDTGNMMANGLSFDSNGQTYLFQHVSTRPITDKTVSHFALWAMRHASVDDAEATIEP